MWTKPSNPWRRRFALLPVTTYDGPTKTTVWWQWYWARCGGDCREVMFTDPTMIGQTDSPQEPTNG